MVLFYLKLICIGFHILSSREIVWKISYYVLIVVLITANRLSIGVEEWWFSSGSIFDCIGWCILYTREIVWENLLLCADGCVDDSQPALYCIAFSCWGIDLIVKAVAKTFFCFRSIVVACPRSEGYAFGANSNLARVKISSRHPTAGSLVTSLSIETPKVSIERTTTEGDW